MSDKPPRANKPHNRTDTLIGAGMRIAGNIGFSGTLRIQGDVLGDVASDGTQNAAVVVDSSGSLTGKLVAPFVHVRGRVIGPVQAAETIDVYRGATVVGDTSYGQFDIQEGGIVEGVLTPLSPEGRSGAVQKPSPIFSSDSGEGSESPEWAVQSATVRDKLAGLGGRGALIGVVMLGVIVASVAWLKRPPAETMPSADSADAQVTAPTATPDAVAAHPSAPASPAPPVATAPVQPAPGQATAPVQPEVPAASPPAGVASGLTDVQGINSAKPAGVFLLISKEQTVFFRKKRSDSGEGGRVAVPARRTVSVQTGEDDQFRIAEGHRVEIYYQGRKLSQKIIDEGSWFRFIPITASEEEAQQKVPQ